MYSVNAVMMTAHSTVGTRAGYVGGKTFTVTVD